MLGTFATPTKLEFDEQLLDLFETIPFVTSKIAFTTQRYGYLWSYEFQKCDDIIDSTLIPYQSNLENRLKIIFDDDGQPHHLVWDNMKGTTTIDGNSTLKMQTIAWLYFYKFLHTFGPLLTIITSMCILIIAKSIPQISITFILVSFIANLLTPIESVIPYQTLNDLANEMYMHLPKLVISFLRIRVLIIGIKIEEEVIYFLGSSKNSCFQIKPIDNCPNGTHICIFLTVDIGSCKLSQIDFNIVEKV
jgi:hypothetical protein